MANENEKGGATAEEGEQQWQKKHKTNVSYEYFN